MSAEGFSAPEHLTAEHDVSAFDSGTPELDNWLKRRALANEALGTSRTYVVTEGGRVVAFYALANGAVAPKDVSAKTSRNMPDPIPVMVLARLAVDSAYQKQGLGSALLRDALLRTIAAAEIAGIPAGLLHALPLKLRAVARVCCMRCKTTRSVSMCVPDSTSVGSIR